MVYIILLNLQFIIFFNHSIIENLKKILISHFIIDIILVYRTIIILYTLNKVFHYIKLKLVKD